MIALEVKDEITPMISLWLSTNPKFIRSLTKSVGWYVQKNIKQLVNDPSFNSRWPARMPYEKRRKLAARFRKRTSKQWMGRLKKAIGYGYDSASSSTMIGWTSSASAYDGDRFEKGVKYRITPTLRRYFALKGMVLSKDKPYIDVPARPLFEPAMKVIQPKLKPYIEEKVSGYIRNGGFQRNPAKKNHLAGGKYKVFG